MDSWWVSTGFYYLLCVHTNPAYLKNPAVEFQAMDRIHRLGQHRPVQAIKLVIEDSIESRIIQLQEKKSGYLVY